MKKILSIDGGGIRGIIPITLLAQIEKMTGKPISKTFDLIAGTSIGGIIALMLTVPDANNKPKYSALDIKNFYIKFGKSVFKKSFFRTVFSLGSLLSYKYSTNMLDYYLNEFLGNIRLNRTLTDVIIPAYETEGSNPYFFKSRYARTPWENKENPYLKQVARATSAAPTYFEPFNLNDKSTLIDGGLFANNPAVCAYSEAKNVFGDEKEFLIVSLGTGEHNKPYTYDQLKNRGLIGWARPILDNVMNGASRTVDYQLNAMINKNSSDQYYRFQVQLDAKADRMDDASDENLRRLETFANNEIKENYSKLTKLCNLLREKSAF